MFFPLLDGVACVEVPEMRVEYGVGGLAVMEDVEIFVWLQVVVRIANSGSEFGLLLAEGTGGGFDVLPDSDIVRVFEEGMWGETSREGEGDGCEKRDFNRHGEYPF